MLHNAGKRVVLYCSSLSEGLSSLMGFCGNPEGSGSEMKNIIAQGRAEKSSRWLCVNKRSGHLNKHKLLINAMQTQSFARRRLFDWTACALRALGSHSDILISIVLRWVQTISVLNIDVCRSMLLLNWWNKGLWRRRRKRGRRRRTPGQDHTLPWKPFWLALICCRRMYISNQTLQIGERSNGMFPSMNFYLILVW